MPGTPTGGKDAASGVGSAGGWHRPSPVPGSCECHLPPAAQLSRTPRPCGRLARAGNGGVRAGDVLGCGLGRVSALCRGQSPLLVGWWGWAWSGQGGGGRRGQDPGESAGSDLHGGAVPQAGGGLKGSWGPCHSPIVVGTRSCWDRTMAWLPLLLAVLAHSTGAMARVTVPGRGLWAQGPRAAARAGLCSWGPG